MYRESAVLISPEAVERLILTIREQKVLLDADLTVLYGVTTKRLNEQFRRNRKRFPEDFAFHLSGDEAAHLRSQIATLNATLHASSPARERFWSS